MNTKISVITVVYNDVKHIRDTMESFFSQTWEDKEYIVIDGGSSDGTVEIIQEYAERLAYWCSEPDSGIYDAMNKGISHCCGEWINILNCGDSYVTNDSLSHVMNTNGIKGYDVLYGDSVEMSDSDIKVMISDSDISKMELCPIYRHGSSLVRTEVQKKHLYRTDKENKYGFALDWDCIYNLYKTGYKFKKVNVQIESYLLTGVSNSIYKTLRYNFFVTTQYGTGFSQVKYYMKHLLRYWLSQLCIYRFLVCFIVEYIPNSVLPHIPFWCLRRMYCQKIGMHIGVHSLIMKHNSYMNVRSLEIGAYSHINQGCILDARGGITIGNNVSISHRVNIMTGGHDYTSKTFACKYRKIVIDDFVWIGIGATILQGVRIKKGAVVCAGAVVTKDVEPYTVVAGIPAKVIAKRPENLDYKCVWNAPLS